MTDIEHMAMKVGRFLLAGPFVVIGYAAGFILMVVGSIGSSILCLASFAFGIGTLLSLWEHSFLGAGVSAFLAWFLSPFGFPMLATFLSELAVSAASIARVWALDS